MFDIFYDNGICYLILFAGSTPAYTEKRIQNEVPAKIDITLQTRVFNHKQDDGKTEKSNTFTFIQRHTATHPQHMSLHIHRHLDTPIHRLVQITCHLLGIRFTQCRYIQPTSNGTMFFICTHVCAVEKVFEWKLEQ